MTTHRGSIVQRGSRFSVVVQTGRKPNGSRIRTWYSGFESSDAAEEHLTKVLRQLDMGKFVPPSRLTVREFVEFEWVPDLDAAVIAGTRKVTTVGGYKNLINAYVLPHLGHEVLQDVNAILLNQIYTKLLTSGGRKDRPLSKTTVHSVHVVLRLIFQDAIRWRRLTENPTDEAREPQPSKRRMTAWTPGQTRNFLESIKDDLLWHAVFETFAMTGLRRGELAGLTWGKLDLEQGELHIDAARVVMNYEVLDSTPKTEESSRSLKLDAISVANLKSYRARLQEQRIAMGLGRMADAELVFMRADGSAIHPELITKTFKRLTIKAGLPTIRLHGLRHSYATAALEAGVAMKVVSERLGHSSTRVTEDIYTHVTDTVDQDAADRTSALIRGTGA